jgi:contactin 1
MPPTILTEPDSDIIFDPRVNLELPCLAIGDPTPVYTWTKNGQVYNPNAQNTRVIRATDSGLLTFTEPEIIDQGYYQCNATNTWGKSNNKNYFIFFRNFRYGNIT